MASEPTSSAPPAALPSRKKQWWLFGCLLIAVATLGLLNLYAWVERRPLPMGASADQEAPETPSFDGSSEKLQQTIVVPTLERPIPDGKSALWCATLPLAWQELAKETVNGPLQLEGAEAICRELSASPPAELEPEHYYASSGFVRKGAADRIRSDMKKRFPLVKLPASLDDPGIDRAIAYAYLEVAFRYDYFFNHSKEPMRFKDAAGRETPVHAFGVLADDKDDHGGMREQVLVLFRENTHFAVDLSGGTKPYQITLARMERKATLRETLDALDRRIGASRPKHLNNTAILLVPTMNWRVEHRFAELENKPLVSQPGRFLFEAHQSIQFKMDRKGVVLRSDTMLGHDWNGHPEEPPHPDHYLFDRPFLVVMKKRDARQPFFVMWVDNAELL